jgi:uncharacterized membrane protein YbhN (UPF0104 family)
MAARGKPKSIWRRWLPRAAGSAVLLGLLFWYLPTGAILAGFARVPLALFLGVFAAFLAGHVVAAGKWWVLLGHGFPFVTALRAHFAGLASNLLLPGVAGGDAVRAGLAQVAMKDGARVVAGSVADRLIDMLALAILALSGILMLQDAGAGAALAVQVLALVAGILFGAVVLVPLMVPRIWAMFPKLPARGLALRTAEALRTLGRRPVLLIGSLLVSLTVQGLFVFLAVQLALAVGITLPIGAWYFAWPLAKILAVLPISLGGLGLREASLAALLTPFGAVAADVVAAGLVWQAVLFLTGALGAAVLSLTGFGWRAKPAVTSDLPHQGQ